MPKIKKAYKHNWFEMSHLFLELLKNSRFYSTEAALFCNILGSTCYFNPFCAKTDQHQFSANNISTVVNRKGYEIY